MSEMGQDRKGSRRARRFRSSLDSGHAPSFCPTAASGQQRTSPIFFVSYPRQEGERSGHRGHSKSRNRAYGKDCSQVHRVTLTEFGIPV